LNIPFIRANYQPVNSLRVTLISPADTRVVLFDQDCGATVNLRLGFDDDAPSAVVCPPDDGIVFKPLNPLAAFIGENTQGTWTLEVAVVRSGFGASGALEEWQLEFCAAEQPANPTLLTRDTLYVPPTLRNSITPLELNAIDPAINDNELLYTVVTLPEYGTLTYDGEPLLPGSQFKQRAIDNWLVQYQHHGGDNRFDAFSFVIENGLGGFLPITTLPIVIDDNAVVGTTAVPRATTELQLFPNPARDAVTLDLAYLSGAAGKVSLLTAQGQVLRYWQQVGSSQFNLPLQGIPTGLYLVRVSSLEGDTRVGRLQVVR
jgi:subtilisin-like proprotein convertase family protein